MRVITRMGNVRPKAKAQEDYDEDEDNEELTFTCTERVTRCYKFSIDEEIGAPSKYRALINILHGAAEGDVIEILFNSGGGRLDSAVAIISAIFKSEATVVGYVVGDCYSAASMIALACHELHIEEFGTFMVHSASYGLGGTHREISDRAVFEDVRLNKIYDIIYTGFLTEPELDRVKGGATYWMQSEEVVERLEKRQQLFEEVIFQAEVGINQEIG